MAPFKVRFSRIIWGTAGAGNEGLRIVLRVSDVREVRTYGPSRFSAVGRRASAHPPKKRRTMAIVYPLLPPRQTDRTVRIPGSGRVYCIEDSDLEGQRDDNGEKGDH